MSTMDEHEMGSPEILVDGDGEEAGHGKDGTDQSGKNTLNRGNVTRLEDALRLVEKLDQIAIVGAPSIIPNKDMADFLSRKLAKSIAYHPDVRNSAYIRELVDHGFAKRNAQKIVWTARKLSRSMPVDATVIRTLPAESLPATGSGIAHAPQTAAIAVTRTAGKHRRGASLWRNYSEIFKGYEKNHFKREDTPVNPKGTYMPEYAEKKKYGAVWQAVGFEMVPEDLPKILPALKETGLLEVYKVDPAIIQELGEEREKMLAAGRDMRLAIPPEDRDQAGDSRI